MSSRARESDFIRHSVPNEPHTTRAIPRNAYSANRIGAALAVIFFAAQYNHRHHWHNDLVEERLMAMSVTNTGPGDALLFRIDSPQP
jgi:hypothetical protein